MITYIDIITGFLESGKTTFINRLLSSDVSEAYENAVLLVCEEGLEEYDQEILQKYHITKITVSAEAELDDEFFRQIEAKYSPDYIVAEYNGTWDISRILSLKMPFHYQIRTVLSLSQAGLFQSQLTNMAALIQPHMVNSNLVVFNRHETLDSPERKKLCRQVRTMNPRTRVLFQEEPKSEEKILRYFTPFMKNQLFNLEVKLLLVLASCLLLIPVFAFRNIYDTMQSIATVFLSILMQAIPFLLLGAFLSSAIQIFVSTGRITKSFSRDKPHTFLIAAFAGFFMPVCDCGMVPLVSGLLKKNMPLPQVMTFWLASSAVNPIVILSVLYAFPGQAYLVWIRILSGVLIGILVGVVLHMFHIRAEQVMTENIRYLSVSGEILKPVRQGNWGKSEAVFLGARMEFFRMAGFVIIGAAISSVLQALMPENLRDYLGASMWLQFLIMLAAAVFMSTCSTSNAFIGRSFAGGFQMVPIMSFITMGPMLDIKNMIMLAEILKKRFLAFLAGLIIVSGALVFGIVSIILPKII